MTFQKAENDAGENFSTSHADTYHAVYYVEPVNQNHPVYQIGRNLIVKEPVTAAQREPQTEQAVTEEDTGSDDEEAASQEETETVPVETEIVEPETAESETGQTEGLTETEFDAALEESETENTTDEESGLTLSDVLEQAGEQDIDLIAMEDGETVSFTQSIPVQEQHRECKCDVTRGAAYYYADYGLGSYVTYKYTVKFGSVLQLPTVCSHPRRDLGMVSIRSPNWVTAKHWQKCATTVPKHPVKMDFFLRNILIFQPENSLSLSIWQHPMPITAVTLFLVRMQPDRLWQWNSTITA